MGIAPMVRKHAQPVSHKKLLAHAQTKSMVFKRLIAPMVRKHAQLSPLPAHAQTKSMVFKHLIAPMVRKHAQLSPLPAHAQQPQDQLLPKISLLNHALTEPPEKMPNAQPVSHKKLPAHAQTKSMVFKRLIAPMERKHAQPVSHKKLLAHAQTKSMVFKR